MTTCLGIRNATHWAERRTYFLFCTLTRIAQFPQCKTLTANNLTPIEGSSHIAGEFPVMNDRTV